MGFPKRVQMRMYFPAASRMGLQLNPLHASRSTPRILDLAFRGNKFQIESKTSLVVRIREFSQPES